MNLQKLIKMGAGLSSSVIILAGLNGCTSNQPAAPYSAANPKQPSASFESSAICANNSFLQKYQCSFVKVEQAARAGDPDAQYALGYLYYYGIGTAQDRQTGLMWIRKAAAQGQPVAQQALQALSTTKPAKKTLSTTTASPTSATSSSSTATSLGSAGGPTTNNTASSASASSTSSSSTPAASTQPARPLTDYLPNYGEKRVDTTATTTPAVDLSAPPANQ